MKISIPGIDPGPTEAAYCLIDDSYQIVAAEIGVMFFKERIEG